MAGPKHTQHLIMSEVALLRCIQILSGPSIHHIYQAQLLPVLEPVKIINGH
jgi:hypothetical protein